jgi:hypothetical protein
MAEKDFRWFRHFWTEQFPALTDLALDRRVKPVFNIADDVPYEAWHIPLGELRRLDEILADLDDVRYGGMKAHQYM